jgi:hypothetical protein
MKVLQLPDVLHEYLVHVLEKHASSGIHPEEGIAVAHLWDAVTKHAQHFDDQQVRAAAAAATPQGQSPLPNTTSCVSDSPDVRPDGTNDMGPR